MSSFQSPLIFLKQGFRPLNYYAESALLMHFPSGRNYFVNLRGRTRITFRNEKGKPPILRQRKHSLYCAGVRNTDLFH